MGKYLDIYDVCYGHPIAEKELKELENKAKDLAMLVRILSHTLKKVDPEIDILTHQPLTQLEGDSR